MRSQPRGGTISARTSFRLKNAQGLTSTHTVYRSVLVFRRALAVEVTTAPEARAGVETQSTRPDMTQDDTAGGDVPRPFSARDDISDAAQDTTKSDRPQS